MMTAGARVDAIIKLNKLKEKLEESKRRAADDQEKEVVGFTFTKRDVDGWLYYLPMIMNELTR